MPASSDTAKDFLLPLCGHPDLFRFILGCKWKTLSLDQKHALREDIPETPKSEIDCIFQPLISLLPINRINCQCLEVRLGCARVFRGDLHQADHPPDRVAEAARSCRCQRYFAASSIDRVPCIGLMGSKGFPLETGPRHVVEVAQTN